MYTDLVVCIRDGKYVWGALKRRVYTRIFKAGCKDVYIRVGIWVIFPRYFRLNYLINSKDRIVQGKSEKKRERERKREKERERERRRQKTVEEDSDTSVSYLQ